MRRGRPEGRGRNHRSRLLGRDVAEKVQHGQVRDEAGPLLEALWVGAELQALLHQRDLSRGVVVRVHVVGRDPAVEVLVGAERLAQPRHPHAALLAARGALDAELGVEDDATRSRPGMAVQPLVHGRERAVLLGEPEVEEDVECPQQRREVQVCQGGVRPLEDRCQPVQMVVEVRGPPVGALDGSEVAPTPGLLVVRRDLHDGRTAARLAHRRLEQVLALWLLDRGMRLVGLAPLAGAVRETVLHRRGELR